MAVAICPKRGFGVIEMDEVQAVKAEGVACLSHNGVRLFKRFERDTRCEQVLGIEAYPEALVAAGRVDHRRELIKVPSDGSTSSSGIFQEQGTGRCFRDLARLIERADKRIGDLPDDAIKSSSSVAADVEHDARRPDCARDREVVDERSPRGFTKFGFVRCQVDEVRRMAIRRVHGVIRDLGKPIRLKTSGRKRGRLKGAWVLGKNLDNVGAELLTASKCWEEPSRGAHVCTDFHRTHTTLPRIRALGLVSNLGVVVRKFFVRTFGCQMNEHDSERIATQLQDEGLERTEEIEDADIVVINTCCIRENADNKFYGFLGHIKALRDVKPDLQIAVGGCLVQKDREKLIQRAPYVDAVFGTYNVGRAAALLRDARVTGGVAFEVLDESTGEEEAMPSALLVRPELPYAAWVTIQVGCDNSCAFCIVPQVRGKEQSRPFGALVSEIEALARAGTTEVTLLGQNVNSYGRDLTTRLRSQVPNSDVQASLAGNRWASDDEHRARPLFADLLRAVGAIDGIRRIRFTSPHPKDLLPETIQAMAETPAVCEQLHLPLQSGSDRVLAAMRRGYSVRRYLERLERVRSAISGLAVTTDIIVGFPGETEADFEATLEVVAEAQFDGAYTFIFSPRAGTRAALMEDAFVPQDVIAERFARLKAVVDRSALKANLERIGFLEEIVVEGPSRKDPTVTSGRTRQAKLVHFDPKGVHFSPGTYATAQVTSAGAHHLSGELVGVESVGNRASPKRAHRRSSIPVHIS